MLLQTANTAISFDVIKQGDFVLSEHPQYFADALVFCQKWLTGETTFQFKTSGSTGIPKIITATRQQMQASALNTIQSLQLTSDEHIFICLNPQTIAGTMMLVRGLLLNALITITAPSSVILQTLPENHPYTFTSFVPVQLHSLKENTDLLRKMNRFHHILVGGSAIHPSLENILKCSTAKIYHTYGMTETLSHIALKCIGTDERFHAFKSIELKTDQRNCLCIKGEVTANEWLITNDIVELSADNTFTVLGRYDEVINTGGIKVFPQKTEAVLQELLPERNLFVYGIPDEKFGQKVIAVIEGEYIDITPFQTTLAERLNKYEIPKSFYFIKQFPQTTSGKVDIQAAIKKIK